MSKLIDLTGEQFGRLTVIQRDLDRQLELKSKSSYWLCQCECGNFKIINSSKLITGNTTSCGCLQQEHRSSSKQKYNQYQLLEKYGIGYTFKGEEFYFDLEYYDKIKNYCWRINKDGYVVTTKNNTHLLLHRIILNCPDGMVCDHINDKNRNDNRLNNIRIATYSQNMQYKPISSNNTSGIKGVRQLDDGSWGYEIQFDCIRERKYGLTKEEAIKQRKEAEEKYHKEFTYKGE